MSFDVLDRHDDRRAPEVERRPDAALDAALTQEILTADRRGPEAVQGVIALLSGAEREAAIALLQRTRGNHYVAETLGFGSSERDVYETNQAAFDARASQDTWLQRALARHRTGKDAPEAAPAQTVETLQQAEQAGLDEQTAVDVAAHVEHEAVAVAQPAATTVAPEPEVSARDTYLANRAALDAKFERDALFQRALARHRGEQVEPPLPGQTVEPAPSTPAAAATAEADVAAGPVVKETVTEPPAQQAPAEVSQAPAALSTAFQAAQAAPVATCKEGIDSLNNEGSYDYRLAKVQQIRGDILNGTEDAISPDVSRDAIDATRPALAPGGISDEQMVAIQGYTSQDYLALNAAMRNPDADPAKTAQLAGYIGAVKGGLDALPDYEGEVYRGTAMSQRVWSMWERAHADGGVVSDAAFSSSSKNEGVAEDFLANTRDPAKIPVFCRIQSRTGKQVEFLSRTANEAEVLFNAGAKFKIMYIEETVGPDGLPRKEVFMREVLDDDDVRRSRS